MGIIKKVIDELAKHKLLIYFVIIWGGSMIFWSLYELNYYVGEMEILPILHYLLELGAGLFLAIFGLNLMNIKILGAMDKEKILVYFLMLWAGSFFFTGIHEILYNGQWMFEYFDHMLAFLGAVADFFAGAVLGLFAWNLLNEKEPNTTQ